MDHYTTVSPIGQAIILVIMYVSDLHNTDVVIILVIMYV